MTGKSIRRSCSAGEPDREARSTITRAQRAGLAGAASETLFKRNAAGLIYATSTRHLSEGAVCGSQDSDIHQVSNLQDDGEDLITLHIYSPPLLLMNIYSLTDDSITQFHDPVHGFMNGDGI